MLSLFLRLAVGKANLRGRCFFGVLLQRGFFFLQSIQTSSFSWHSGLSLWFCRILCLFQTISSKFAEPYHRSFSCQSMPWLHFLECCSKRVQVYIRLGTVLKFFYTFIHVICKSKVDDRCRWWLEGSLFNSYYTKVYGRALLLSLDCSTLPLILTL